MKYLVTGGYGFIGSNFIKRLLDSDKKANIINIDDMLLGSNPMNLKDLKNQNYSFVKGNICDKKLIEKLVNKVDFVINFAAESHVDRSIYNPWPFIESNIHGVYTLLEAIRRKKNIKFLQISTDEVYGSIIRGSHKESDELHPSNPYSATKASAEMLVKAYAKTYDLGTSITRCTNNFGTMQFPEKLIPKTIISALRNESIPIHGDGKAKRQWIHVFDHCDAILKIIKKWKKSSVYNISADYEINNLNLVKRILKNMGKSVSLIEFVPDRPGQDKRYSINSNLIKKQVGWKPKVKFERGLEDTIRWYISNKEWWKKIIFAKVKNPTPWKSN